MATRRGAAEVLHWRGPGLIVLLHHLQGWVGAVAHDGADELQSPWVATRRGAAEVLHWRGPGLGALLHHLQGWVGAAGACVHDMCDSDSGGGCAFSIQRMGGAVDKGGAGRGAITIIHQPRMPSSPSMRRRGRGTVWCPLWLCGRRTCACGVRGAAASIGQMTPSPIYDVGGTWLPIMAPHAVVRCTVPRWSHQL